MPAVLGPLLLAVGGSTELTIVVKATVIVATSMLVMHLTCRAQAAVRHALLAATFAALLVLPLVSAVLPTVAVKIPVAKPPHRAPVTVIQLPARLPESAAAGAVEAALRVGSSVPVPATTVLRGVWLAGASAFLAPLVLGLCRLQRISRHGRRWPNGERLVRTIAHRAALGRRVTVLLHARVPAPMTFGILRPTIVLPVDAPQWPERDLRQAIVHELEHIRRADWLTHIAARTVCALYWFHPLVWSAWRHLGLEAEQACDDAVLREGERTAYAEQLLLLAHRLSRGAARPLLSMASRSDLGARISAVLDANRPRGRATSLHAIGILTGAAVLVLAISPLRAVARQQPTPAPFPTFEAASVKVNKSADSFVRNLMLPSGQYRAENVTLRFLIQSAYQIQPSQLTGGPAWLDTDRFNIIAKADPARVAPPLGRPVFGSLPVQVMMRALLADRFKLVVHDEARELPIYALVMARSDGKLGSQMRAVTGECAPPPPPRPGPPPAGAKMPCGQMLFGPGHFRSGGTELSVLAQALAQSGLMSTSVDRIVQDKTGLTGLYEYDLQWTPRPDESGKGDRPQPTGTDTNGPSLFTALQEQLGLKLDPRRGPVDVLVVDRAEKPAED